MDTIANLPFVNLVRTPIGASLEAVAADLEDSSGPKIVVLVTDGEETCDGDPAAAIKALVASGIDVRVNIVGFAIDDAALQQTFAEWADLGNGQYIDAGNEEELGEAVAQAVLPTYEVQNSDGAVIAIGQVGGQLVSLPPGTYTVVIRTNPEIVIEEVVIESGQETDVVADGSGDTGPSADDTAEPDEPTEEPTDNEPAEGEPTEEPTEVPIELA